MNLTSTNFQSNNMSQSFSENPHYSHNEEKSALMKLNKSDYILTTPRQVIPEGLEMLEIRKSKKIA